MMLDIGRIHLNFTNNLHCRCTVLSVKTVFQKKKKPFENKFLKVSIFQQLVL